MKDMVSFDCHFSDISITQTADFVKHFLQFEENKITVDHVVPE